MDYSEDLTGKILNIQKFSLHDGSGIRTVVFFKGCPLCCQWCANPESQSFETELGFWGHRCIGCDLCRTVCPVSLGNEAIGTARCVRAFRCVGVCPSGAIEIFGKDYTVEEVMRVVRRDAQAYDFSGGGVTLSGGEPLAQPVFTAALMDALHAEGIDVVIETSGYAAQETALQILGRADTVLFDIKHVDEQKHIKGTGVSNKRIIENFEALCASGAAVIMRIPLIGDYNDDEKTLRSLTELARRTGVKEVHLLKYHSMGKAKYAALRRAYDFVGEVTDEKLALAAAAFEGGGIKCVVGG
jgi:pyruvate formate lyase activating enzyme